ncbi:MAG: leucine-rich repeat domain-containing protein, partial [Holosporales bacterium]|nr:leucine-rich repeat domain-containing protein [Holosporales bacterium]
MRSIRSVFHLVFSSSLNMAKRCIPGSSVDHNLKGSKRLSAQSVHHLFESEHKRASKDNRAGICSLAVGFIVGMGGSCTVFASSHAWEIYDDLFIDTIHHVDDASIKAILKHEAIFVDGCPYMIHHMNDGGIEAIFGQTSGLRATGVGYRGTLFIPDQITFQGRCVPVVAVGIGALSGWQGTRVIVGRNVKVIGDGAFYRSDVSVVEFLEGSCLERIEDGAFAGSGLVEIVLPDGLSYIGEKAFSDSKLKRIYIPAEVSVIPEYCFWGCKDLEMVRIAQNSVLTELGDYAFTACTKLYDMNIPDSVNTVGEECFSGCCAMQYPQDWYPANVK